MAALPKTDDLVDEIAAAVVKSKSPKSKIPKNRQTVRLVEIDRAQNKMRVIEATITIHVEHDLTPQRDARWVRAFYQKMGYTVAVVS